MREVLEYGAVHEAFDPVSLTGTFAGDLDAGINACVECCDRHTGDGRVALTWASAAGNRADFTFDDLQARSAQVATSWSDAACSPVTVWRGCCRACPSSSR